MGSLRDHLGIGTRSFWEQIGYRSLWCVCHGAASGAFAMAQPLDQFGVIVGCTHTCNTRTITIIFMWKSLTKGTASYVAISARANRSWPGRSQRFPHPLARRRKPSLWRDYRSLWCVCHGAAPSRCSGCRSRIYRLCPQAHRAEPQSVDSMAG